MKTFKDVDEYIASFPDETQVLLEQMRSIVRKAAPKAEELVAYGMAAYKQEGALVYFGGYAKHIGFYPMPSCIESFKSELSKYKSSKGAIQFPLDGKLPVTLIAKMVKFRVSENVWKAKEKKEKKEKKTKKKK